MIVRIGQLLHYLLKNYPENLDSTSSPENFCRQRVTGLPGRVPRSTADIEGRKEKAKESGEQQGMTPNEGQEKVLGSRSANDSMEERGPGFGGDHRGEARVRGAGRVRQGAVDICVPRSPSLRLPTR